MRWCRLNKIVSTHARTLVIQSEFSLEVDDKFRWIGLSDGAQNKLPLISFKVSVAKKKLWVALEHNKKAKANKNDVYNVYIKKAFPKFYPWRPLPFIRKIYNSHALLG